MPPDLVVPPLPTLDEVVTTIRVLDRLLTVLAVDDPWRPALVRTIALVDAAKVALSDGRLWT